MYDEGYGKPVEASCLERNIYGSSAGFHSNSDDHLFGYVLHRNRPADYETGLRGTRSGEEKEAEIVFFQKIVCVLLRNSEKCLNIAPELENSYFG